MSTSRLDENESTAVTVNAKVRDVGTLRRTDAVMKTGRCRRPIRLHLGSSTLVAMMIQILCVDDALEVQWALGSSAVQGQDVSKSTGSDDMVRCVYAQNLIAYSRDLGLLLVNC